MLNKDNRIKKTEHRISRRGIAFLYVLFSMIFSLNLNAQCAMCRASLESEGNATKAEAVNDGIVYLMGIPYLLVGIVGYVIYRMYRAKKV
ncbi:hypothetical protein [Flavobacterium sp.]|uniref:hypothetical protein n=1 Tax=Flavobacterium sp. TaxID=239 RepID=UPI003751F7A1